MLEPALTNLSVKSNLLCQQPNMTQKVLIHGATGETGGDILVGLI